MKKPSRGLALPALLLMLQGCQNLPDYHVHPKQSPLPSRTTPPPEAAKTSQPASRPVTATPATPPAIPASPMVLKPATASGQPARKLADGRDMPAVQGLLVSAENQLALGDLEAAGNSLERAQRLAPQSAQVYLRLSDVRLKQGRAAEAEQFARKGLAFAQGTAQQAALWRAVAAAAERQGKTDSARQARQKADQLEAGGDRG